LNGNVNDYEILLMLDPELAEERQAEILTRTQELVTKLGGDWESQTSWGRRRLAYEIDHKPEGVYHLLVFRSTPEALDEVSRVLKITDGVMRHLATRRPKPHRRTAEAAAPPPPAEVAMAAEPAEGGEE
jgi:small subunit ribosomal protein S6